LSIKGNLERKTFSEGKEENGTGKKISVELSFGIKLGVYAQIGATSIFGAEATGEVSPEVKLETEVEWEDGKCIAKLDPKLEACDLQFKITTTAMLVRWEKEWKIGLWEEHKLWTPAKEWELYNHKSEGHPE
jgi:hypothetical protein